MENSEDLEELVKKKIEFGDNLLELLLKFQEIDGIDKLERKINQEITFLKKILRNNNVKKEYLQCTNLTHFSALIDTLNKTSGCISVQKTFSWLGKRLVVDIVADNGLTWLKVVARNPKSLSQIYMGEAGYGTRSVADQASDFLNCAQFHPCLFKTPKIAFIFANEIDDVIISDLESLGVIVNNNNNNNNNCDRLIASEMDVINDKINLDVSAMIAYVSSLTNGNCNYVFKVPVLTQQAEWERSKPVRPILNELFKGKRLFCCETAKVNFDSIVNTVGGPNERIRAEEFMKLITVLSDDATVSDTEKQFQFIPSNLLPIGGKIKQRSKIIFRFGDNIQAMTVTANEGFVRSAKQRGINFVVFVHESRALTEQKECSAERI